MLQIKIVEDLQFEPVTLDEVKAFLQIDFDDFDSLLEMLLQSARVASENVTGLAYGRKLIQVTGNSYTDKTGEIVKIYPISPFIEDKVWEDQDKNIAYQYYAGYEDIPSPLKNAILMRVATGFASRQDGVANAVNKAVNAYIITERQYVNQFAV